MTHAERRDLELPYISDEEVYEEMKIARRLTQELNTADRADFDKIRGIIKNCSANRKMRLSIRRFTVITAAISKWGKISLPTITVRL